MIRQLHVVPNDDYGWAIETEGVVIAGHTNKENLLTWAVRIAQTFGTEERPIEIVPHDRHGKMIDHNRATYPRRADPPESEG